MTRRNWRDLPYALALLAGVAVSVFANLVDPFSKSLAIGTATFGMIVAGFTATQRNMLIGMGGTKVMRFIVRKGYQEDTLNYMRDSVFGGLIVAVLSVVWLFLPEANESTLLWRLWFGFWSGAMVLVFISTLRNERIVTPNSRAICVLGMPLRALVSMKIASNHFCRGRRLSAKTVPVRTLKLHNRDIGGNSKLAGYWRDYAVDCEL